MYKSHSVKAPTTGKSDLTGERKLTSHPGNVQTAHIMMSQMTKSMLNYKRRQLQVR